MASIKAMSVSADSPDVIVVGGGIIGLAVAWRARQRGMDVLLLERGQLGQGASRVAAGMLAPVAEVEFGEGGRRLLALGRRSAAMWPAFAAELLELTGVSSGLTDASTLLVARDDDGARELERQIALRNSLGLRVRRLLPGEAREHEPALAPVVRLALELPDDHSLDPRLALTALERACARSGVRVREHAPCAALLSDGRRVGGVKLADGERLAAAEVVIAAGAWTGGLAGLPAGAAVPVRPVKGQTLRLRDPAGPGLLRGAVRFEGGYLVPRADGRYVLGGTVEERGFDASATAGAAYELLRRARELVPGVSEMEIEELCVGLRPGTPDNVAAIGRGTVPGLLWATGHYRNGILQAPVTAELIVATLAGEQSDDELLSACTPLRFAAQPPVDRDGPVMEVVS
jgi:glycine oxidase